ncbi:MAG: AAA family ATPase [Hyphomicrobiaceae bacterium]|nr:AAA family ATPase [Hyphomicrobiaceae bacterium]
MLQTIEVAGLGPHTDTRISLEPMSANTITGPSEAGKSTLIDAVCFALWGTDRTGRPIDIRAMQAEAREIRVALELANGATVVRTLRRSKEGGRGKTTRILRDREYRTEKEWTAALRDLGENVPALRQVVVPMAWRPLVEGAGHGRPFRDVLASILPKADLAAIVAELMREEGYSFERGDPIHERDAEEIRRRANRDRDRAAGDAERLELLVAAAVSEQTPDVDLDVPRAIVEAADKWRGFDREQDRHVEREEHAARVSEAAEGWKARLSELGERPATAEDATETTKKALHEAQWKRKAVAEKAAAAVRRLSDATAALAATTDPRHPAPRFAEAVNKAHGDYAEALKIEKAGDVCPTCNRDGWAGAPESNAAAALEAIKKAEGARTSEADRLEAERVAAHDNATEAEAKAQDECRRLEEEEAAALEAQQAAEDAHALARQSNAPAMEWDARRRALGDMPHAPAPEPKPTPPDVKRPHEHEEAEARAALKTAERDAGAARQRSNDLGTLRSTLEDSRGLLARLTRECERLDVLVSAIRRAPSVAARRQLAALGDIGPVSIEFRDKDGGIDLLVDGRPFYLASTGRLVVADAWLREGIRRARGISYLPIFVDCVQDVAGQRLHLPAPAIALRTTETEWIDVGGANG